ncbi:restriction endonuclease [Streptomyces sp. NPDC001941]|uniref:restriction endonuclease n=1 Tax=Streptomyces sp. NPDC001941 TaxID=3154659 RepID=UPI003327BAE2
MTVPVRRPAATRLGGRKRADFDLRELSFRFGAFAFVVAGVGFTYRSALRADTHRFGALLAALAFVFFTLAALHSRWLRRVQHDVPDAPAAPVPAGWPATGEEPTVVLDPTSAPYEPVDPQPYEPYESYDWPALDPYDFEDAVADLCEREGCRDVEVVGGAGDLGADVVATAPDGRRVVLQCKRYAADNKVGSQDLQRFGGTCYTVHDAQLAVVVTTSEFTEPALDYADRTGILCYDLAALSAWGDGTGPAPWKVRQTEFPAPDPAATA